MEFKKGDIIQLYKGTNYTWQDCFLTVTHVYSSTLIGNGTDNDGEYKTSILALLSQCRLYKKHEKFEIKTEADYYTWLAKR